MKEICKHEKYIGTPLGLECKHCGLLKSTIDSFRPQKKEKESLKSPESIEGWEERLESLLVDFLQEYPNTIREIKSFIRQLLHDTEQSARERFMSEIITWSPEQKEHIVARAKAEAIASCIAAVEELETFGDKSGYVQYTKDEILAALSKE